MSEAPRDQAASAENHKTGPDYFSFCTREVATLLSHDEDLLPFVSQTSELSGTSGEMMDRDVTEQDFPPCISQTSELSGTSGETIYRDVTEQHLNGEEANCIRGCDCLFSNGIGSGLSDFKRERLKTMLRQGVVTLSQEVDEIMDPVLAFHQIRSQLQNKKHQSSCSGTSSDGDEGKFPCKKQKTSSSSSTSFPAHASPFNIETNKEDIATNKEKIKPPLHMETEKDIEEVNADLQFLLENNSSLVAETMKRHSDELSTTLKHMEQQLEELLDIVTSKFRLMTLTEKHQLQNLIQKLPPRNLDRIVEIIQHSRPEEAHSCEEIHVDLEKLDNATLWRLYYYTEAVESAQKCLM